MGRLMKERADEVQAILDRYPVRRSAMMPLLWVAQDVYGHITEAARQEVAELCEVTLTQVEEVVTFYTQYRRKPVGRFVLGVCRTLPCALLGAEGLVDYLSEKLGIQAGQTTEDGLFTIEPMECLGACSEAPVMLVNKEIHGRLTREKVDAILEDCRRRAASDESPSKPASAPAGGE